MSKKVIPLAAVIMIVVWCISAFPWGGEHGEQAAFHSEWPAGLKELLDREEWVYGYWVNANDWFFFVGDTEAFNQFLKQYAKLKDTPLKLVLHAGRGRTGRLGYGEKRIQFDWELKALRRGWHPEAPKDPASEKPAYVVIVELWLGGKVELSSVKVPLNVEVKSGGEIEQFITEHEADRKEAE